MGVAPVLLLAVWHALPCPPAQSALAVDPKQQETIVARSFSPVGTLLVSKSKSWELPFLFDDIPAGKMVLVLPGARGIVHVKEGDVRLTLVGNLPDLSPTPILETVAVLQEQEPFDLDMTLATGRIIIENRRMDSAIKIRVRAAANKIECTLAKAGAVVIESFRAAAPGLPSKRSAAEDQLNVLVLRGKTDVSAGGKKYALESRSLLHWSGGRPDGPSVVKDLPAWIDPRADLSAKVTAWYKAVESVRRLLAEKKSPAAGLAQAVAVGDVMVRAVAVLSRTALETWTSRRATPR